MRKVDGLDCGMLIVLAGLLMACSFLINGLVLSLLWGWFVVPLFNAPQLTIPYAIGIALIAGLLVPNRSAKNEGLSINGAIFVELLAPLLVLAIGYLVHLFI